MVDRSPVTPTHKGHSDWIMSVAFSPDSKLVMSGSMDNTVKDLGYDDWHMRADVQGA
jgi:WD40 repeat protein